MNPEVEQQDSSDDDDVFGDNTDPPKYPGFCYKPEGEEFKIGIARVPLILLQTVAAVLREGRSQRDRQLLPRAWMRAIAHNFPDTPLGELRAIDASLLPAWLIEGEQAYHRLLVLRPGGLYVISQGAPKQRMGRRKRGALLAGASDCPFKDGFASEGMLCDQPPIPLRVLDFLEDGGDLVNLALVCKATHKAGHVLLEREFPEGLGSNPDTLRRLPVAILQRKEDMLKSALSQPISSNNSSSPLSALSQPMSSEDDSSSLDSDADSEDQANPADADHHETDSEDSAVATEPDYPGCMDSCDSPNAAECAQAKSGLGNPADTAEPEDPGTNPGDVTETSDAENSDTDPSNQTDMAQPLDIGDNGDTGEPDDLCEGFTMTRKSGNSVLELCISSLSAKELYPDGLTGDPQVHAETGWVKWEALLKSGMQQGIVLDLEGVTGVIAMLEAGDQAGIAGPRGFGACPRCKALIRVLRAAKREGQGVIVHPGCTTRNDAEMCGMMYRMFEDLMPPYLQGL